MTMSFEGPSLRVPVREYTKHGSASVALVGMVHWADPAFYEQVGDYVGYREQGGSEVHYELVHEPDMDAAIAKVEIPTIAKTVGFAFAQLGGLATKGIFKECGLVSQLKVFPPKEHWENHDLGLFEFIDGFDAFAIAYPFLAGVIATPEILLAKNRGSLRPQLIDSLNTALRRSEGLEKKHPVIDFLDGNTEEAIIERRNQVALDAAKEHLASEPGENLTLIWGAAHLAGIGRGLQDLGFELSQEFPFTAIAAK